MISHKTDKRLSIRTGQLISGALLMLVSQAVMSLGLGEIKLNSVFNEPLNAEITLLDVGELTESEIIVKLASRKDFQRAGVLLEFFLKGLQFTTDLSGNKPKIVIESEQPIREPFLNFLVDVQWTSGRLLREYTLLIDLPDDKARVRTIDSPYSRSSAKIKEIPRPVPQTSVSDGRSTEKVSSKGEYRVFKGDNLWSIARRLRLEGTSIYQTMRAIQEMNPDAFIDGNINLLMHGKVLRLPSSHQITISHSQAVEEVSQYITGASIDAVNTADSQRRKSSSEPVGRLKLFTAADDLNVKQSERHSVTVSDVSHTNDNNATINALSRKLTVAQEELAVKDRQLSEERQRVARLEQQLDTMQRLIEINSAGLAETQKALNQIKEYTTAADSSDDIEEISDTVPESDATAQDELEQDSGILAQFRYSILIGVGVLVTLLLLLWFYRNKNYDDEL